MKESQAPQEPPAQRVGESIFEAESGKFLIYFHSFLDLSVRMNTSETL